MKACKDSRQQLGRWGEGVALEALLQKGLRLVGRNVRTPYGEIDLILQDADEMVFVEVKARTNGSFGLPEAAVNGRKQGRMVRSALYWLQSHPEWSGGWRVDVVAVCGKPEMAADAEVTWYANAVQAGVDEDMG